MSRDLSDINATSRSEMVCPECWERGLVAHQRRVQAYDSDKDKIIHASGCRTEGCKHHYKNGEPIPAKVIEMQLGAGRGFNPKEIVARASLKTVGVAIGISLFAIALLIAVTGLPFLSGSGGGGGIASAETSVSKADGSISEVGGGPNWTIYKYGDQYVVAGENSNGETVYLNANGEVVDSVQFFDTEQDAIEAIQQWEQIVIENPGSTIDPDARNISSPELDSPWSVFKVNSSAYVVAAENSEGNVVFLHPDGSVSIEPYFYDTQMAAEEALIEWNLDNLPSSEYDGTTASEVENVLNDGTTAPISGGGGGGGGGGGSDPIDGDESEGSYNVTEVKGSVTGPSGNALTNAKVILDSGKKETTTDQSGAYSFDSVESGTHTLSVIPTDLESTAAPRSAKFEVGDSGNIELQKAPSSVIYFTDSDGDVARNDISWTAPEAQQISALGNGSRINSNITFANSLNANDVTVSLSSVATSSEREIQFNASSSPDFTARGNTQPRNPELTLYGDSKATDKMLSGNSTKATHTLEGNQPIENPDVTLEGFQEVSSLKQQQAASGNSQTFTIGGNRPTINHQLQLSGDTESRSISTSKSQNSFTHDVRGNLRPENVKFQVTGQENTNNRRVTGEIKDGELTVEVNGNQPAKDVQLQLNGQSWTGPVDTVYFSGSAGRCYYGDDCTGGTEQKTLIPAPPDGSTREYILDIEGDWYDRSYDNGQAFIIRKHVEPYEEYIDGIFGNPGYWVTYNTTEVDRWATTCGYVTCDPTGTEPPIDHQKEVVINPPAYPENPNYGKWVAQFSGQSYSDLDIEVEVIQKQKTRDISVSGPGISGTYSDNVGGSGSSTINIGSLSPGTHTFDIQTSGELGANYELTFQERSVTENVRVKADGDTRCSKNTVPESTTCTVDSSNVSPSSTLSFSSNGPTPEVSMSYTAQAGVASGSVNMGGQTFNYDASNNEMGVLTSGDTYEMSTNAFSPGQKELTVQSQSVDGMNPTLQAVVEYKERTATKNVRLMHDGSTICQKPNALTGSTSCDMADSTLVGGDNITIKANGLPVKYELGYGAVAKVGDATLSIDGTEFSYPEDFGKSQPLGDGEKATIELDSLTLGDHTLDMSAIETNGITIDGKAQLSYIGDILTSYKPSVMIINPNGSVHKHPVPASQLDNERLTENTTIRLPQRYFDKGGNEVVVKTADGSFVRADLEATGLQYQANRFRREEEAE